MLAEHGSVDEASSLSIDRPPSEKELPPNKSYTPLSFPTLVLLAPASIFGVLARLGLQGLTHYDGQSVFPLAYVQTLGCFIMGLCLAQKEVLSELYVFNSPCHYSEPHATHHRYGPLYTALATGGCDLSHSANVASLINGTQGFAAR